MAMYTREIGRHIHSRRMQRASVMQIAIELRVSLTSVYQWHLRYKDETTKRNQDSINYLKEEANQQIKDIEVKEKKKISEYDHTQQAMKKIYALKVDEAMSQLKQLEKIQNDELTKLTNQKQKITTELELTIQSYSTI